MKEEVKEQLIKRLKSLLWRAGAMIVTGLVVWASENIAMFELPPSITVLLGLMLGEATKYLNTNKSK